MELFLPVCLFIYFTLVVALAKSKIEFSTGLTTTLLVLFYISTIVSILSVYLFSKEIYFISDFLNKTVIWYPIFFAGIILGGSKHLRNWIHKVFLYAFIFVGFMLAIMIFVPFVGLSLNAYFASSPGKVYYNDSVILVQDSYYGILSKPNPPDIYRKKLGIFAIKETSMLPCEVNQDIGVTVEMNADYYEIVYLNSDGSQNCSTQIQKN